MSPWTGHRWVQYTCAPLILGHEFAGEVVAVGGDVRGLHIGDRVAPDTLIYCGYCISSPTVAREALVSRHQGLRYSYMALREEVDRAARGLLALGLAKGDRVGIWSPNRAEWVVAQFATPKVGVILVNINPAYQSAELETVQAERCTALHGVPTMFIAEPEHPRFAEFDFSSPRTGIMAGSPCPIEVMKKVNTLMHMPEVTAARTSTRARSRSSSTRILACRMSR